MRNWWVVVTLVACGPSYPRTNPTPPTDPNAQMLESDRKEVEGMQHECDQHKTGYCVNLATRYLEPPNYTGDKPDPEKAKGVLIQGCKDDREGADGNVPLAACDTIFRKKLVTDPNEAIALCKDARAACVPVVGSGVLNEDQIFQLCFDRLPACAAVPGKVTTDKEHEKEMLFMYTLYTANDELLRAMEVTIDKALDEDDDADTNACHKDTDCKGDRICQGGSCVDAPAKTAAKPVAKADKSKFQLAECDAFYVETHKTPAGCPKAVELVTNLDNDVTLLQLYWKDIPKDRHAAFAPACKLVSDGISEVVADLCK
jgi:hypothetical protein